VPASEAMPEDVARIGYADFRLNGKTAAETFTHGPTAALARATCEGTAEDVARAASAGGNPNQAGLGDVTPLIWAIACENIPNIEAVLAVGGNPNQPFPHFGSPVIIATGYRNPEILRSLLRHGGDPNATDDHETALSTAYTMGRFGAPWTNFDTLMAAGADLNRPSPDGDTIVETAAMFRDFEHVLQFLERGYAGDLVRLGRFVTMDDGNLTAPAQSYLTRTREWLTRHGVRFPVPALGELQRDSRGFYIQP